jgi:uncharacterized YceG family protein
MPLFRKTTSSPYERTSEDRERERVDRARRRAAREEGSDPDLAVTDARNAPGAALPPEAPMAPVRDLPPPPEPAPAPAPPPPAPEPVAVPEAGPPAEPIAAAHAAPAVELAPAAAAEADPPAMPPEPQPVLRLGPEPEHASPAGDVAASRSDASDGGGAGRRLPPPPTRRDALLERRRRRLARDRSSSRSGRGPITRGRFAALAALLVLGFAIWFLVSLFQPFHGSGSAEQIVSIPKGSSAGRIGTILANDGVVSSGFFFNLRATLSGKRGDLHSGVYRMRRGMSYSAAIDVLSKPPPAAVTVRVLIPEGKSRREIAAIAAADGLSGDYLAASTRSPLLSPAHYGAPRSTGSLEGFLFPATYEVRVGAGARELVAQQLTAFRQRYGASFIRTARSRGVSAYQMLTIASMVEREAAVARDRALIAAVIYNRLRAGIPLGIDATIRYALNDWSRPLTDADLRTASPYNTRTHRGLPPTPIGNPGAASISAAAHPARASFLYYVAGSDGCGEHVFSTSFAQFQRDAAAYQAAVAHNGGRVPSCRRK